MMQISGLVESRERAGRCGTPTGEKCRCASSCSHAETPAPVLLLGLGNPLMGDDGAGQALLTRLSSDAPDWGDLVEFIDGGTQGLALLGTFEKRKAVVFLDAISLGEKAGAVHVLKGQDLLRMGGRATTAHEGSAPQILTALELLGETPEQIVMIGVEPERISLGIGLSPVVDAALDAAAETARAVISSLCREGLRPA